MSLTLAGAVILLGLLLIMAEVFLIPGTTVVGIVGGIIVVTGVYLTYSHHGVKTGNIALVISLTATGILTYLGFKAYSSRKFSLNDVLEGRVNLSENESIRVDDEGVTVSNLKPNGKAMIKDNKVEVYSLGGYIDRNIPIKVVKIRENKIFVEPK